MNLPCIFLPVKSGISFSVLSSHNTLKNVGSIWQDLIPPPTPCHWIFINVDIRCFQHIWRTQIRLLAVQSQLNLVKTFAQLHLQPLFAPWSFFFQLVHDRPEQSLLYINKYKCQIAELQEKNLVGTLKCFIHSHFFNL